MFFGFRNPHFAGFWGISQELILKGIFQFSRNFEMFWNVWEISGRHKNSNLPLFEIFWNNIMDLPKTSKTGDSPPDFFRRPKRAGKNFNLGYTRKNTDRNPLSPTRVNDGCATCQWWLCHVVFYQALILPTLISFELKFARATWLTCE